MSRFIPAQIQLWTQGELIQTQSAQADPDHFYSGISTDTRTIKAGEIFLALRGERFDGHHYLDEAVARHASMLIIDQATSEAKAWRQRIIESDAGPDLLLVADTLTAYQQIAAGFRQTLNASVVGITGSVGKTTTRRMVNCCLSSQLTTHQTHANLNNEIGLPLTLLQATPEHNAIIAEMAMDRPGEIDQLSKVASPDIAIITGIGFTHAEYLGSRENILREKTDIIHGMKSNDLLILNGDDDLLSQWALTARDRLAIWLICSESNAGQLERAGFPVFWSEKVSITEERTTFVCRSSFSPDESWPVELPAPGYHLIPAALFALASAYSLGLDMKRAAAALLNFSNTGNRQRIVHVGHYVILDDAYNAAPESMIAALETFDLLARDRRRLAVLGGMRELGRYQQDMHRLVGQKLADYHLDVVFLIGDESRDYVKGAERGERMPEFVFCSDAKVAADMLERILQPGDCILIKGSRKYELEKVSRYLLDRLEEAE